MSRWFDFFRVRDGAFDNNAPTESLRYTVIDTELTSLEKKTNRILSIGAIRMEGPKIRLGEQFYRVVNPGVELPERAIVVHGLRPADVAQGEDPGVVMHALKEFVRDSVLVGHFVRIDTAALKKEFKTAGERFDTASVCTARIHRWLELRNRTYGEATEDRMHAMDLATVARHYGVSAADAHHALGDAFVTAQLWQRLLTRLESAGVRTWGALRKL